MATKKSKTWTLSNHRRIEIALDNGPRFGSASLLLAVDGNVALSLNYHDGGRGDPMNDALEDAVKLRDLLRFMEAAPEIVITQFGRPIGLATRRR